MKGMFFPLKNNILLGRGMSHQVPDVLCVWRLECELLRADGGQGERLSKGLVAPG